MKKEIFFPSRLYGVLEDSDKRNIRVKAHLKQFLNVVMNWKNWTFTKLSKYTQFIWQQYLLLKFPVIFYCFRVWILTVWPPKKLEVLYISRIVLP